MRHFASMNDSCHTESHVTRANTTHVDFARTDGLVELKVIGSHVTHTHATHFGHTHATHVQRRTYR